MALYPGVTAAFNADPIGISGEQDRAIQDAQIGIVEMCFEPRRFDKILRIGERYRAPPRVYFPYSDALSPNAGDNLLEHSNIPSGLSPCSDMRLSSSVRQRLRIPCKPRMVNASPRCI
jgi:hypothetical protein